MKIYRRARTWVMAGMLFAVLLLMAVLLVTVDNSSIEHMNDFMGMAVGISALAIIFTVVIASDAVASEFTWGTIKLLLIRPVKRWKILLSKYIASLLFALFSLLFICGVSALLGLIFFGTGGSYGAGNSFGEILREYGFQSVMLLLTVTFSFMISSVFRGSTLAIVLSGVILFFGSTIAGLLVALDQQWAKYLLFLNFDLSIYFREFASPPFPGMTLGFTVAVQLVHMAAFFVIAFLTFNKRDVSF